MIFPLPSEISIRHPRTLSQATSRGRVAHPLRRSRFPSAHSAHCVPTPNCQSSVGLSVTLFGFFSFFSRTLSHWRQFSLAAVAPFGPRLRFPVSATFVFCPTASIPSLAPTARGTRFSASYQAEYKALMLESRKNNRLTFHRKSHKLNSD